MKKYGILLCAYNTADYIDDCLESFIGDDRFVISAVSVPFLEYRSQEDLNDGTTDKLREYLNKGDIHNLVDRPKFIKEHEARNLALKFLKDSGVDYIFIVDSDEIYSKEDLDNIVEWVENNPANWYRVCLKNYVFDKDTYLADPFDPPRIFTVNSGNLMLANMYWDNDFLFFNTDTNQLLKYTDVKNNLRIPKEVAWVTHYSWMNDEIGKRKVEYQQNHFGHSSFKWDKNNGLTFDENYYKMIGEDVPKTLI